VHKKIIFQQLENLLEKNTLNLKTSAADTLHEIAEITPKRSLIVIFSDMFDKNENTEHLFSALQHLKHKKHEIILFHVLDQSTELKLEYENRPYHFIDMETGDEIKLNPNQIKKQYLESVSNQISELINKCGQFGIDFIEADINKGFEKILYAYLVKRKLLSK
jgi:uncharacterized protein (DUF58 family)